MGWFGHDHSYVYGIYMPSTLGTRVMVSTMSPTIGAYKCQDCGKLCVPANGGWLCGRRGGCGAEWPEEIQGEIMQESIKAKAAVPEEVHEDSMGLQKALETYAKDHPKANSRELDQFRTGWLRSGAA